MPAPIPFNCSYPYCSWDDVQTLGVCNSCEDVTALINSTCDLNSGCTYTLPNADDGSTPLSVTTETTSPVSNFNAIGFSNLPSFDASSGWAGPSTSNYEYIAGFAALNLDSNNTNPTATRCRWHWCLQTQKDTRYNATADQISGPSVSSIISTPLRRYLPDELNAETAVGLVYVHYTSESIAYNNSINQSNVFVMDAKGEENLARQLASFFTVQSVEQTYEVSQKGFTDGIAAYLKFSNLSEVAEMVSTSLTNAIRGKENVIPMAIQGLGYTEEPYTHVRWGWLIPSMLIVALSDFLVLLTIFRGGAGKNLFKSSILAPIFHGYDGSVEKLRLQEPETPETLEEAAETMQVRFERNEDGDWRLREVVPRIQTNSRLN